MLLAIAKILDLEEAFSREWRLEERLTGQRLPALIERLAATVRRMPGKQSAEIAARIKASAVSASTGATDEALLAMRALAPRVETSAHPDSRRVALILQGTRDLPHGHRALLVLLALALRKVLGLRPRSGARP